MTVFSEIGRYLLMIKGMFSKPENMKMYWKEFIHQCSEIGIGSLGIVVIISIFMGAVSTVQTAYQLVSPLIPQSAIAQLLRDSTTGIPRRQQYASRHCNWSSSVPRRH